jgi:hypothetical protein
VQAEMPYSRTAWPKKTLRISILSLALFFKVILLICACVKIVTVVSFLPQNVSCHKRRKITAQQEIFITCRPSLMLAFERQQKVNDGADGRIFALNEGNGRYLTRK